MTFYYSRLAYIILIFGFVSGLPLSLTASTLTTMLADNDIDIKLIGLFSFVGIPYMFKYLWSPLVDNIRIPVLHKLGRRKSWLIVTQALLAINIMAFTLVDFNADNLVIIAALSTSLAFLSATQDITIDAFRIELVPPHQQAAGVSAAILGYRIGMLASGAGALYIAHFHSWHLAYFIMSICVVIAGIAIFIYAKEEKKTTIKTDFNFIEWFANSYGNPFINFLQKKNWWLILVLILCYKMSDAFIGPLSSAFFLDVGYTKLEIANVVKVFGLIATLVGTFACGFLLERLSVNNGLLLGLVLQMLSNLVFIALLYTGPDVYALGVVISIENFCSGFSCAALTAYISNLCNIRYTATQFALLSSLAALGRTTFSAYSGFFQNMYGWEIFFIFSALISIPALLMLILGKKTFSIRSVDKLAKTV